MGNEGTVLVAGAGQASNLVHPAIAKLVGSPAAYADWDGIHQAFTELRKSLPLGVVDTPGFDPFWLVTKHADIMEIGRKPLIFANNAHRCALLSQAAERDYFNNRDETPFFRVLISMDPPEHSAYRRLTFKHFTPNGVRGLEDSIRALAVESIQEMVAQGDSCDFVESVALRYPLRVILSLMGLHREDEELMLRLTQELFNPQDPEMSKAGSKAEESEASSYDLGEFPSSSSSLLI